MTWKTILGPASWRSLITEVFRSWGDHRALRLGAALAYYTVFSIAPLFIIALAVAGMWVGDEAARGHLFGQLSSLLGPAGAKAIEGVLASADRPKAGLVATIIASMTLFTGATGVFVELQDALNTIWDIPTRKRSGIWRFIKDRLLSFAMVLAVGFLLLVSLVVSAALAAFGKYLGGIIPGQAAIGEALNFLLSLGMVTLLFALIFKVLPDVKIRWREVWLGAAVSAVLFNVGKFGLGYYLGRASVTSAYGAAGSFVAILLWVYYASQTLFIGAEFTKAHGNKSRQKSGQLPETKDTVEMATDKPHNG